ncbi:MAG: hypothetical protein IJY96_05115 [Oscillospiraceae bacterium]|nr:hypothetical protein [Oscillospiraceae bacterium]
MRCDYCGKELSAALQERDRLLEALKMADVECRYCAHANKLLGEECLDCVADCSECLNPCPCLSCENQSNWEWVGFGGED